MPRRAKKKAKRSVKYRGEKGLRNRKFIQETEETETRE